MKMTDSDNLVKTPFFSLLLLPIYKLFGTGLTPGRITTLVLFCLFLAVCANDKYWKYLSLAFIVIFGLQLHIFQFAHLILPEMVCITFILAGIYCLYHFERLNESGNKNKLLLLSVFFFSLSYYTKIQYLYIIALPVLFVALKVFQSFFKDIKETKKVLRLFIICLAAVFFFAGVYYIIWYKTNRNIYNYVLLNQTTNRFVEWGNLWNIVEENYKEVFISPFLKWHTYLFFISLLSSILICFKPGNRPFKIVFTLNLFWLLIELHKIAIWWLPARYALGMIIPMGFITANLLSICIFYYKDVFHKNIFSKVILYTAFMLAVGIFIYNGSQYINALSERKYSIKRANDHLSRYNFGISPMMGTWATNLNWENKATSITIWKEYFNDKNVIETFHPKIIVTEYDEADSDQAFMSQGVNLENMADSVNCIEIGKWDLLVYWLP